MTPIQKAIEGTFRPVAYVIVAIFSLVLACEQPNTVLPESAARLPCEMASNEYAVLSCVLNNVTRNDVFTTVLVRRSTAVVNPATLRPSAAPSDYPWCKIKIEGDTVRSFGVASGKPCVLAENEMNVDYDMQLVGDDDASSIIGEQWTTPVHGKCTILISVSRPGINGDQNEAVVYCDAVTSGTAGKTGLFVMKKKNGEWKVVDYFLLGTA